MIRFSLSLFNAAVLAVSTDPTRYYLGGVFCHPHPQGGVMLVATDGHLLTAIWDKLGFADECAILPAAVLTGWRQTKRQAEEIAVWSGTDRMCSVYPSTDAALEADAAPERRFLVAAIDGTFPDYVRVIPRELDPKKIAVQPFGGELLTRIVKIAGLWSSVDGLTSKPGLTVAGGDGAPSLVTLTGGNDAPKSSICIVVMPMRSDTTTALGAPAWALAGVPAGIAKAA
jgi:DNA polymerase-3 subunit beta